MKSITDEYTLQLFVTISKEVRNHDHLKQAIIELLWSPQIHSCAVRYNKIGRIRAGPSVCLRIFYDTKGWRKILP